jgi:hypothetical protein
MNRRRVHQIAPDHAIAQNATTTATRSRRGRPRSSSRRAGAEVREVYGPPRG